MAGIAIVSNSRAESSPLTSVIAALPEAAVITFVAEHEPHVEMSSALHYFTRELRAASPRIVILLGDRYETLAAALAATFLRIPLAHIHGGETTTGAFDDAFRHGLTHLAEQSGGLHFAATEKAAARVTELTNGSQRVHIVGAPGLDGIPEGSARRERHIIVVSYHPETLSVDHGATSCADMLHLLSGHVDTERVVFTGVNKDPGHEQIEALIAKFCEQKPATRILAPLPRDAYISLLQEATMCIGNSSSFAIEAPWIGIPSVIVGNRQQGRELASSVYPANGDINDIAAAIACALAWGADRKDRPANPIYRGGNVGALIAEIVREFVSA